MNDPEDAGNIRIENQQPVQGQVVGDHNIIHQYFHPASDSIPTAPSMPVWNVPFSHNLFFTGREEILAQIRTRFQTNKVTALSQPQAMSGLGGIGKTQIAVEYAHFYRHDYQAVLWTRSDTREALISGYVAIAHLLNLPQKDEQDQDLVVQAVRRWFVSQSGWLLILDSADNLTIIQEFLPTICNGHILLTTRAQAIGGLASRLEVDTMDEDVGAQLLLRRAGLVMHDAPLQAALPADLAVAKKITEELGGLPLALDQAGAYIEETQCGLLRYLQLYQTRHSLLLQRRGGAVPDHPESVATTWSLSFEQIEQRSHVAADLLRLCAFLHYDAIPEEIITHGASHLGSWLSLVKEDPLLFDEIIAILGAYSLIHREPNSKTLNIHRLVQVVLRDTMDENISSQWANYTIQTVDKVFPHGDFDTWPECERLLPHTLVCVNLIELEHIVSQEAAHLLNQVGNYLSQRGRYAEAEPILMRTVSMCEQVLGADHLLTAGSLSNLAALYQELGKYDEAEALAQRALARLESALDTSDSMPIENAFLLATSLNNLAALYQTMGKYTQAEQLFLRAIAIWMHKFEPIHPRLAYAQNNLGSLYEDLGRYDDAEALYQQALFASEKMFGPNHPHIVACLTNLSGLYLLQRRYSEAEPLIRRGLQICETGLGPDHLLTAVSLDRLAGLYFLQKAYEQVEPLWQRVLTIDEYVFGPNHPRIATRLGNLADLYATQGNYTQAEPLLKRALTILEMAQSKSYSEMIMLLSMYADLLRAMKRDEEAEELKRRAKDLYEDQQRAFPQQPDQQEDRGVSEAAQWVHHDALDNLERLWNLTEDALKRQLTEQERERVYQFKQFLWALLDDMKNDTLSLLDHTRIGQKLEELLQQTPFVDLEERPLLKHIPGIGYVSDDFPFSNEADMKAHLFWSQFSHQGSTSYICFLVLLRHFSYVILPAKGKVELRKLRQAVEAWRQDWLTGPLPSIPYNGPSETAKRVARLLEKALFRKKYQEIVELPLGELYKRLHPDDVQQVVAFREEMAERFEAVKDQVITDLEKLQPVSLEQEHDLQYNLVHKRLSELVEQASEDTRDMCSLVLQSWEETVLEESKTGEAFALYGLPPRTVAQLVPENRIHEGHNPRPWTGEGSEQVEGSLYVIDVDQNPFEVALDDDYYSTFLPLNVALRQAFEVTNERFFMEDGEIKQPDNPECRRIYQGIVSATHALHLRREIE